MEFTSVSWNSPIIGFETPLAVNTVPSIQQPTSNIVQGGIAVSEPIVGISNPTLFQAPSIQNTGIIGAAVGKEEPPVSYQPPILAAVNYDKPVAITTGGAVGTVDFSSSPEAGINGWVNTGIAGGNVVYQTEQEKTKAKSEEKSNTTWYIIGAALVVVVIAIIAFK